MARPLRFHFSHAVYYVINRENAHQSILKAEPDRQALLGKTWSLFSPGALVDDLPEMTF